MNRMFYFWRQLLYDINDRYDFFLKETKCVVSVLLSSELQTYGDLWLMKAKRNYLEMMQVRAFWHGRTEWYCRRKLLHVRVGWKGFHQDIHKTERRQSKQQPGTWQRVNLGANRICVSNELKWQYSLHISLFITFNSPFIQFISLLLGKVKFNNANLYRKVYACSWKHVNYWQNWIESTLIMAKVN